jgi:hypothetical protein
LVLCFSLLAGTASAGETNVVLENALFRCTISPGAGNVAFVDRAPGTDYLRATGRSPGALVRVRGKERAATAATLAQGRLTLQFGTNGFKSGPQDGSAPGVFIVLVRLCTPSDKK